MLEQRNFSPRKFDQIVSDAREKMESLDKFDMTKLAVENLMMGLEKTFGVKKPKLRKEVCCRGMKRGDKVLF